jgi:hypothetical protein
LIARHAAKEYEVKRIALAAAGTAVVGLTACSYTATPTASHGTVSVPVSCGQQYQAWNNGPGKGLVAALQAVSVAGTAGKPQALTVALKKAGPAVARGSRHSVPACADPRGYWSVLLMHVNAAVASKGSVSSAQAAMKDVPKIENELTAELKGLPVN